MLTSWYGGLQKQAAAWAAIQHQSGAVPLVEEGKHAPVGCKTPAQILPARKGVHGLIAHHLLAMKHASAHVGCIHAGLQAGFVLVS